MFFIAGGTGFIGRHLVRALSFAGMNARCLVRSAEKMRLCSGSGLDAVSGDITDRESLKGRLDNCDVVVHLVGILEEKGGLTFEKLHVEGTRNLVEEAKRSGIKHLFYQSALGASLSSWSRYFSTKAEAEEIIRTSGIPFTIFRPSLVIGEDDGFTEKLRELTALGPAVPVPGNGLAKMQPIYVEDWVKCFMNIFGAMPVVRSASSVYEFGGPEHLTYNEILSLFMEATGIKKPLVHVPLEIIRLSLPLSGISQKIGGLLGRKIPSVTDEQLRLLQLDNICDIKSVEKNFGFSPVSYRDALKKFIVVQP